MSKPRTLVASVLPFLLCAIGIVPLLRAQPQELPVEAPLSEAQALERRLAEVQQRSKDCTVGCEPLQGLLEELRTYREDLEATRLASSTLERQRAEQQKELEALENEPAELSPDAAQQLFSADIEVLEQEVRLGELDHDSRQDAIEKGLSELTRLRRRQEDLARHLSDLSRIAPATAAAEALIEEQLSVAQKRRDLAAERIKVAMESLVLGRQRLSVSTELLARRSGRLSSVRLSEGIPPEEIERTRERVEQLRVAVAERATELAGQLVQVEENLESARQQFAAAEAERAAVEQDRPAREGPEMDAWKRRLLLAEDAIAAAQSQIDALNVARELVQESSHLDEFLLSIQGTQLQHDEDFNGLIALIREHVADPTEIERGMARIQERVEALRAEAQALEITSARLRGEMRIASEQVRHTALRLDAVMSEAQAAADADAQLNRRVELIEALLNRRQAWSEGLSSRRNLIEEALAAANDQLKKYQDSVNLLSTYVSGTLRFNLGTLVQAWDWLREAGMEAGSKLAQAPAYWLELRLSLQEGPRRERAFEIGLLLGLTFLGLGLVDLLLSRVLRRQRRKLGIRSKSNWLILGGPMSGPELRAAPGPAGGFLVPQAGPERPAGGFLLPAVVYALSRCHRPMGLATFCLLGWWEVPELRGPFVALCILALVLLVRRLGSVGVMLLFSRDPEIPSLRLAQRHAPFLTRWSFWLLLLWPPILGVYGAALSFTTPVSVHLTLGLLAFATALFFLLLLLVYGRARVVYLIQVHSAREKPSLPVLLYNRLIAQVYLLALLVVLAIIGFFGAGYDETARWLAVAFVTTVAIVAGVALLVRGLHLWLRRFVAVNPVWGDLGSVLLHLAEALLVTGAVLGILVVWGVDLGNLWQEIRLQLEREIFKTADGRSIRLLSVVWVLLLLVLTLWLSRRTRELLQKRVFPYLSIDRGQQLSLSLVLHYALLLLAGLVGLNMLGINLTALSVVFGALSLGIGFGLQTIVNNFVSGLILLFERNIRPDDIIDFGGTRVKVEEVRTRCTVVVDEDNKTWIVPNVRFMNETITNWTQNWSRNRYQLYFFILPNTDIHRLRQVIDAWVVHHPDILPEPTPDFRLSEVQFGALKVGLWFSTTNAWPISRTRSRIYLDLVEMLQREGFQMPLAESRVRFDSGAEGPPVPGAQPLGEG